MDKDMVGPSYAHVIEICDMCHLLLQYLSMNSSLNSEIGTVLGSGGAGGARGLSTPGSVSSESESGLRLRRQSSDEWAAECETVTL